MMHKITDILPQGSEIIVFTEEQVLNGKSYSFNSNNGLYIKESEFLGIENIRALSAKSEYYMDYTTLHTSFLDLSNKFASSTYTKIGYCNLRTGVNFSQKDLSELLSKSSKEEISSNVYSYLNDSDENLIKEDVYKFFKLFESSNEFYLLLKFREDTSINSSFHKYLGVASAIYGIYDQCGNGYIEDSDFIPNEDYFGFEFILDSVLSSSPEVSNSILWAAGKVIDVISKASYFTMVGEVEDIGL